MSILNLELGPMVAQHDHKFYRVPMWKNDGKYFVYVRDLNVRMYDDETLPDCIKMRLSMILAIDKKFSNGGSKPTKLDLFMNHVGKEFEEIGWQLDDEYFTLVLKTEELASLQGDTLNKESSTDEH
jgi:hypothetical protein